MLNHVESLLLFVPQVLPTGGEDLWQHSRKTASLPMEGTQRVSARLCAKRAGSW